MQDSESFRMKRGCNQTERDPMDRWYPGKVPLDFSLFGFQDLKEKVNSDLSTRYTG